MSPPATSTRHQTEIRLSQRGDLHQLQETMQRDGAVIIPELLDDASARNLYQRLCTWNIWNFVTRIQGQHQAFDARRMDQLSAKRKAALDERIVLEAKDSGFQYCFDRFPLYDQGRAAKLGDPTLAAAYQLLRSEEFLELGRQLTDCPAIEFADGQATRYQRGHYLTQHTDYDQGMKRIAAYVINLTPGWRADYGGQLQFVDNEGNVERVFKPAYNAMVMFKVPRAHLVSAVAPFVTEARLSITGWFRAEPEDGSAPS